MTLPPRSALLLSFACACSGDEEGPSEAADLWGDEPIDTASLGEVPQPLADGGPCTWTGYASLLPGDMAAQRYTPPSWPWAIRAVSVLQRPNQAESLEAGIRPELVLSTAGEEPPADPTFVDTPSVWYPPDWSRYASNRVYDPPLVLQEGESPFVIIRHPGDTEEYADVSLCEAAEGSEPEQRYTTDLEAPYTWADLADLAIVDWLWVVITPAEEATP